MGKLQEDLSQMDATAMAELVRAKEVTPAELVDATIESIEALNPQLNAVVYKLYDHARKAAAGDLPEGPFTGVPFVIKDLLAAYAGVPMTFGSKYLADFIPPADSELVRRYKQAGLVIVAKTNTPELGILPTTEPGLFGPAHNPWNLEHSTGGSSGGSAAAVAARIVPMGHANDGGGSIRIPASACGLFGMKPTRGRNTVGPMLGDILNGLVCEHAVTRSVRDSAALLDATSGPMPGDPYWAEPPKRPFAEEVGAKGGKLRIAFTTKAITGVPVHADCVKAVHEAAKLCEELGHDVAETAPELNGQQVNQAFVAVWAAGQGHTIDGVAMTTGKKPKEEDFEPLTWALYQMGRKLTAPDYLLAISALQDAGRAVARFMMDYDVLLTPTLAEPPAPLGTFKEQPNNPLAGFTRAGMYVPFTPLANATGQPAMSVPLFWNEAGLPIGTHFIGRHSDEATLFRLAGQLEEARPWADRKPPVCAG